MASEEMRKKTIDTALLMFNSRGCKATTMDDIAAALRISKRTLYETFATKEELLAECLSTIHEQTNELHRQTHSRVDEPLLAAMYMLRTNALFIHRYQRIIEEAERYYPEIHDRFFQLHSGSLRKLLQFGMDYAQERGYLRPDADVEVAIDFLCKLIQERRLCEVADSEAFSHRLNEICFTYLRGMMTVETLTRYEQQEAHFGQVIEEVKDLYK